MNRDFGKVGVFCGGRSGEREISLQTGKAVYDSLFGSGIDVTMIDVGNDHIDFDRYDTAFVALHGRDGEDGKFQATLEYHNIPYTGSNVEASAVSMNKWYTKAVWESIGIDTPKYWISVKGVPFSREDIEYPIFIKPVNEGSSIGISYVESDKDLDEALSKARQYDNSVLLEKAVSGDEYTFSYLQDRDDLPLIKLEPATGYYDYDAKYLRDDTRYIVDPDLDKSMENKYREYSLMAFECLGMTGWGRVDFIVDENRKAWFIEVNSVPGMTKRSLVPMAAVHADINFGQLCISILGTALNDK